MESRRRKTEAWKRHASVGGETDLPKTQPPFSITWHARHRDLRSKGEGRGGTAWTSQPCPSLEAWGTQPARAHPLIKLGGAAPGLCIVPTKRPVSPPSVSAPPQRAEPDICAPSSCSVLEVSPCTHCSEPGGTRGQGPEALSGGGREAGELPRKGAVQKFSLCS